MTEQIGQMEDGRQRSLVFEDFRLLDDVVGKTVTALEQDSSGKDEIQDLFTRLLR